MEPTAHLKPSYSLWEMTLYFLQLGTLGFGGPVALIGYMYRDLVETRKWITESDYKQGLSLAQLAPGPLAAQTAIYLGYVHYGIWGATLTGVAFVVPSFIMVVALGWAYVRYNGLIFMQAVFYGVGASVIGIIAFSAQKLTRKTLGKDKLLWIISISAMIVTVVTESEKVALFFAAGILAWFVKSPPNFLRRKSASVIGLALPLGLATNGDASALGNIFLFFTKAGAFVFGSGLAIVPFLYGGVVKQYHWLTDRQFLDAVAVAMITPGPVVITVGFIGYLVAGFSGSVVAALGTFLPCYFFTVIPAPYFKRYGKRPDIAAFVNGVTAAAVGTITGAVVVLGRKSIVDVPTALLALGTLILLWKGKKIPEPFIILGAALIGWMLKVA